MDRGAGDGWRNKVGRDGGPKRSGKALLSSAGVVVEVEQAAVGYPWVVGVVVGGRGSQQFARKRASTTSLGSTWLRYIGDLVGDWLGSGAGGDITDSSRNRWRLFSFVGVPASRYPRMILCVGNTGVDGVSVIHSGRLGGVGCGVEAKFVRSHGREGSGSFAKATIWHCVYCCGGEALGELGTDDGSELADG